MQDLLFTILLSITPISEVRGAIPYALSQGIKMPWALLIPFLSNAAVVPLLYFFIRPIFYFARRHFAWLGRWIDNFEHRSAQKFQKYRKWTYIGLFLFVAIPLPGTGIYTGVVAGIVTRTSVKKGILSIIAGSAAASIITYLVSAGFIHFLDFLF